MKTPATSLIKVAGKEHLLCERHATERRSEIARSGAYVDSTKAPDGKDCEVCAAEKKETIKPEGK